MPVSLIRLSDSLMVLTVAYFIFLGANYLRCSRKKDLWSQTKLNQASNKKPGSTKILYVPWVTYSTTTGSNR